VKVSFVPQAEQECGNCRFYTGLCRRYAPRPVLLDPISNRPWVRSWFPETDGDEWCGEWEQREGAS
jgi:hypothetical protein